MAEFVDLALQFVVIALGALAGSAFMWIVMGPIVLRRAGPKIVNRILRDTVGLTDEDLKASDGDMFKAMTKKQGGMFADAVNGALGNLIQAKPDEQLESLAKQYGFRGVEDAKQQILGGSGVEGLVGRLPQGAGPNLLELLGKNGSKNRFSGLVETLALIQALGQLSGPGGALPGLPGMGSSGSSTYGW